MTEHMRFYAFEQSETERRKKNSTSVEIKRYILYNLDLKTFFFALIGFLLGGASFLNSVTPCGMAWIGALAIWDRRRVIFQCLPVIAGAVLWTSVPLLYIVSILLLTVFFSIYSPSQEKVKYMLPLTVFTVITAVRGVYLVFSGISDLLLIVTLVESILSAGLSLVFLSTLETWQRFTFMEKPSWEEILCNFILATGLIMGLEHIVIFDMAMSEIAMRLVVLLGALVGGAGGGAAAGAVMGVIPSLGGTVAPSSLGLFAFSGLLGGVFKRFGKFGVIIGFLAGNLVLTFYLLNTSLVVNSIVASLIAAALLFIMPDKLLFKGKDLFSLGEVKTKVSRNYNSDGYVNMRLSAAGEALSSLRSGLSAAYKHEEENQGKNIESILSHISTTVCGDCSLKDICWKTDFYETYKDIMTMFAVVEAKGALFSKDAPETFKRRCSHRKEIIASINCLYEMYKRNDFWRLQTATGRHLAISQIDNTINLLTKIQDNLGEYVEFRKVLDTRLASSLRGGDFPVDYLNPVTVEKNYLDLDLKVRNCPGSGKCGRPVSNAITELTGKKFRLSEYECAKEKGCLCHCRFLAHSNLTVDCHALTKTRDNQEVCGDCHGDFLLSDAKRCLIISDGMGSGADARQEAERVTELVKNVLNSGFKVSFAASILNYLTLSTDEQEIYATADICLLDIYGEKVEFLKMGAAPSYLCSPGIGVKVVAGNSLPLGSEAGEEPAVFREKIRPGDILVMLSDGLLETGLDGEEMELWLSKTLDDSQGESAKVIAERLVSGAVALSGGKAKDDITVIVAVIDK